MITCLTLSRGISMSAALKLQGADSLLQCQFKTDDRCWKSSLNMYMNSATKTGLFTGSSHRKAGPFGPASIHCLSTIPPFRTVQTTGHPEDQVI